MAELEAMAAGLAPLVAAKIHHHASSPRHRRDLHGR
jgi:hypothetical protein